MSFNYKIAAFDLDGTLAESKQLISIPVAEKLFDLAQKIKIVVISGGSMSQFQKQILPAWLEVKNRCLSKRHPFLCHSSNKISPEQIEIANKNLIFLPVCGTQQYFYDPVSKNWFLNYSENFDEKIKSKVFSAIDSVIKSGKFDIPDDPTGPYIEDRGTQITFSALGQLASFIEKQEWDLNRNKKTAIREELAKMLPELEVRVGGSTSIDILPRGFDKAVGLGKLLPQLKMTKSDMIYVGDALFSGGNDEPVAKMGVFCERVTGPSDTLEIMEKWLKEL